MAYDAFISYSHQLDKGLAQALQQALHQLGKPWYKIRQLNTFRDETDLAATPELWHKIEQGLKDSAYFVLLASPVASRSKWVKKEIDFWIANKRPENMIIVLTSGHILWDVKDFNWSYTDALPRNIAGVFKAEPLYVDFTAVRSATDISLNNPEFKISSAQISAAIQNIPLKELIDRDVIEHRKTMRIRNTVIAVLLIFLISLTAAIFNIIRQRDQALKISHAGELVVRALNHNSTTETILNLNAAYQLNPSPFIANLLYRYGQDPTTFYNWIPLKDSSDIRTMGTCNGSLVLCDEHGHIRVIRQTGPLAAERRLAFISVGGLLTDHAEKAILCWGKEPGSEKVKLCILNSESLATRTTLDLPENIVFVSLTSKHEILASGSDGIIRRFNLQGQILDSLVLRSNTAIKAAYRDKDGFTYVLSTFEDRTAVSRYSLNGRLSGQYSTGLADALLQIDLSVDGQLLGMDQKGIAFLWDKPGNPRQVYNPYEKGLITLGSTLTVGNCFFSPSGRQLMTLINQKCIIWDRSGGVRANAVVLSERLDMAAFAQDEDYFFTAGYGSAAVLCWTSIGYKINTAPRDTLPKIFCKQTNTYLIQRSDTILVYQAGDNRVKARFQSNLKKISSFAAQDDSLLILSDDASLQVLRPKAGGWSSDYYALKTKIGSLFLDRRGGKIYSGLENGKLFRFDLQTRKYQVKKLFDRGRVNFICPDTRGNLLIGGGDLSAKYFLGIYKSDLSLKKMLPGHQQEVNDGKFSPDGKLIVTVDDGGRMIGWDTKNGTVQFQVKASLDVLMNVDISADSQYFLAIGAMLNEVVVIDRSGNKLQSEEFSQTITSAKFFGSHKFLAVINGARVQAFYTLPGFLNSGRIITPAQLKLLETDAPTYSVNQHLANEFLPAGN